MNKSVVFWAPGSVDEWPVDSQMGPVKSVDSLRFGKTGLLRKRGQMQFAGADLYAIGADTISGDYLHGYLALQVAALSQSARAGNRAALVNFSITPAPSRVALRLLRSLPREVELWARDELSQERAQRLLGREVGVAPDIGALAPKISSRRTKDAVDAMGPYICLSPNAHFQTLGWYSRDELIDFWSRVAAEFLADYEVLLLPHDLRARPGDVELCGEIAAAVGVQSGRSLTVFTPESAGEAKAVLGGAEGVVSGRMHACVGALASGVPTVGLEYLGKFSGQFTWFGPLGRVFPLEQSVEVEQTTAALRELIAVRQASNIEFRPAVVADSMRWMSKA
ncbi:polysaccharide pyruvyl transferase family protein [Salinibacterium sp. SWN1162]|nr:polysaccharide pyruvyl transferase family protein [Salinibacterium sp. SWN1162]